MTGSSGCLGSPPSEIRQDQRGLAEERRWNGVIGVESLFHFFFAVLLYEFWVLADVIVGLTLLGIVVLKKRPLKSKYFGDKLYSTDEIDPG